MSGCLSSQHWLRPIIGPLLLRGKAFLYSFVIHCAGLEAIEPQQGLRVLQAMLASALAVHGYAYWACTNLASPMNWQKLLKTPGRTSLLYAEFQVWDLCRQ